MIIDSRFSNNEHIVRTTEQWESTSVKYKIIPRGCLCVELTPDNTTRIKIGEGDKYYEQLSYIDADIDMSQVTELIEEYLQSYPTKEEVNTEINDVSNELNSRINTTDQALSNLNTEVDERFTPLESEAHTHDNKQILDNTTASFTIQDQTKLDGIEDEANNYKLPTATDTVLGGIKVGDGLEITDGKLSVVGGGSGYVLPTATRDRLGGVKEGNNITIDANGVISTHAPYSLPKATKQSLGGLIVGDGLSVSDGVVSVAGGGSGYELPPATRNDLGGIKVGDRLSVTSDGTLSADEQTYILPKATDQILGGVKQGNNISIDSNGVISTHAPYSLPIANDQVIGGVMINGNNLSIDPSTGLLSATDTNTEYDAGTGIRLDTPVSGNNQIVNTGVLNVTLNQNEDGLVITKESGDSTISLPTYSLPVATDQILGGVKQGDNISIDVNGVISTHTPYSLPTADASTLGGIKVGSRLTITDGVLSADEQTYSLPIATDQVLGGVKQGNNITIDANGVISTHAPYQLPKATDSELGGIIVGNGLEITDGVLSTTGGGSYTLPPATTTNLGGIIVGNGLEVTSTGLLSVTGGGSGITVDDELSTISTNPVQNRVITNAIMNIMSTLTQLASTVAALEAKVDELIGGGGTPSPGMPVVKAIGLTETIIGESNETVVTYNLNDYNVQRVAYSDSTGGVTPNSSKTTQLGTIDYIPIPDNAVSFTLSGIDVTHDKVLQFFVYVYNDAYAYVGDIGYYTDWYANNTEKYLTYGINKYIRIGMKHASSPSTITAEDISATITFRCVS